MLGVVGGGVVAVLGMVTKVVVADNCDRRGGAWRGGGSEGMRE